MLNYGAVYRNMGTIPLFHFSCNKITSVSLPSSISLSFIPSKIHTRHSTYCQARRRVRFEDEGEDYGHNTEIAMLESYSESARDEVLLVRALVDGNEEQVLVFKGFSSCLSDTTSPDLSKSVLPARAVIKTIDRIRGPFDPTNVEYLEKDITWEAFKSRLQSNKF